MVSFIDQRFLPHYFLIEHVNSHQSLAVAIKDMHLRGAPLIGVAAAYGVYLAAQNARRSKNFKEKIESAIELLRNTRPTAFNLQWALNEQKKILKKNLGEDETIASLLENANRIADEDVAMCKSIGEHGLKIIEEIAVRKKKGEPVNILTHCNAGWLAAVDWGTALSPVYHAHAEKIKIHVWIDETRPRNQGANLTAWELSNQKIPHTVITDSAAGLLMQRGKVDLVLVGCDRLSSHGDAINKIGTYMQALAAQENQIPFFAALPSSSIDWKMKNVFEEAIIEEREGKELKYVSGKSPFGLTQVQITPDDSPVSNFAFDITPAKFISGIITERGVCVASKDGLTKIFPEHI